MKQLLDNFLNFLFPIVDKEGNEIEPIEEYKTPLATQIIILVMLAITILLVCLSAT